MPQRRQFNHKRRKSGGPRRDAPSRAATIRTPPKPPVQYGKSFVLLDDLEKNTFEYSSGAWVPYAMSIAQCRLDCQVKELPQKVNGNTRYEVRLPLELDETT